MNILVVIVQGFDKFQFFFMIEVLRELVIKGTCFNSKVYI